MNANDLVGARLALKDSSGLEHVITHRLGEGGFGHVYKLALQLKGQTVLHRAIKVFKDSSHSLPSLNEMTLTMPLHHENLLPLRQAIQACEIVGANTRVTLPVMIYDIAEGSLDDYASSNGPLNDADLAGLGWCLSRAAAHLAGFHLVHGDIKPSNVLLRDSRQWLFKPEHMWMLGDFGTLRKAGACHGNEDVLACTKNYAPPAAEHAHSAHLNQWDVWSIGQTLYFAATGKQPSAEEPIVPGSIHKELQRLIAQCLELDPSRRPEPWVIEQEFERLAKSWHTLKAARNIPAGSPVEEGLGLDHPLVNKLRQYAIDEHEISMRQHQLDSSAEPETRDEEGTTLFGLGVTSSFQMKYSQTGCWLACEQNHSGFRNGDSLYLHYASDSPEKALGSVILQAEADQGRQLKLGPGYPVAGKASIDLAMINTSAEYALSEMPYDALLSKLTGLNRFAASPLSTWLLEKLSPGSPAVKSASEPADPREAALRGCLELPEAILVQGPPGTGKTRLLAEVAATLARKGHRVLITAISHMAVNNALQAVKRHYSWAKTFKAGDSPGKNDGLSWDLPDGAKGAVEIVNKKALQDAPGGIVAGAAIAGACSCDPLGLANFDILILEEAGQMTVADAASVMWLADRVFMFGDHQQLGPIINAPHEDPVLAQSIFSALTSSCKAIMLTETHRLSRELCAFPSQEFYGGALKPSTAAQSRQIEYKHSPARLSDVLSPYYPSVFVDIEPTELRRNRSVEEAQAVAQIVHAAVESGVDPHEIAVLTPFRMHAREIRAALDSVSENAQLAGVVVVDTVDRMQGQERDLIIVSLTTSDLAYAGSIAGFLFDLHRLNVCITRARRKLIAVGDPRLLSMQLESSIEQQQVDVFRRWRDSCQLLCDWPTSAGRSTSPTQ